jgi:hypothetical protein
MKNGFYVGMVKKYEILFEVRISPRELKLLGYKPQEIKESKLEVENPESFLNKLERREPNELSKELIHFANELRKELNDIYLFITYQKKLSEVPTSEIKRKINMYEAIQWGLKVFYGDHTSHLRAFRARRDRK